MDYIINSFKNVGELNFSMTSSELINLLGRNYSETDLPSSKSKQFYYPDLAIKIQIDSSDRLKSVFFYKEDFNRIIWNEENFFQVRYLDIKEKFKDFFFLEDTESLIIIDLGFTFFFDKDKKSNPFPEEVGFFREDLKDRYIHLYS